MTKPYDDSEFDLDELRQERQAQKRYADGIERHPDPRDPDYPGLEDEDD